MTESRGSFRLIYRSRDLIPSDRRKTELGELFSAARSNNKKKGITGALLVSDDWFVQTLEGEQDGGTAAVRPDRGRPAPRLGNPVGHPGGPGPGVLPVVHGQGRRGRRTRHRPDRAPGRHLAGGLTADHARQDDVLDLMREATRGESVQH